nr:putative GMP synthase [Ipomoea batatas]
MNNEENESKSSESNGSQAVDMQKMNPNPRLSRRKCKSMREDLDMNLCPIKPSWKFFTLVELKTATAGDSSVTPLDQKIAFALRLIAPPERREALANRNAARQQPSPSPTPSPASSVPSDDNEEVKRCNWITKNSDKVYVQFHDECWGVPVYDDHQLFELLALSGMLMDFNWTEILKRRDLFREAFAGFNVNSVAKMGEKEIEEIASNESLMLAEGRVRHIVDNAKCTVKASREGIRVVQQLHVELRELQTGDQQIQISQKCSPEESKGRNHQQRFGETWVPLGNLHFSKPANPYSETDYYSRPDRRRSNLKTGMKFQASVAAFDQWPLTCALQRLEEDQEKSSPLPHCFLLPPQYFPQVSRVVCGHLLQMLLDFPKISIGPLQSRCWLSLPVGERQGVDELLCIVFRVRRRGESFLMALRSFFNTISPKVKELSSIGKWRASCNLLFTVCALSLRSNSIPRTQPVSVCTKTRLLPVAFPSILLNSPPSGVLKGATAIWVCTGLSRLGDIIQQDRQLDLTIGNRDGDSREPPPHSQLGAELRSRL